MWFFLKEQHLEFPEGWLIPPCRFRIDWFILAKDVMPKVWRLTSTEEFLTEQFSMALSTKKGSRFNFLLNNHANLHHPPSPPQKKTVINNQQLFHHKTFQPPTTTKTTKQQNNSRSRQRHVVRWGVGVSDVVGNLVSQSLPRHLRSWCHFFRLHGWGGKTRVP